MEPVHSLEVLRDSDGARALKDGERTSVEEEAIRKQASVDVLEGPRSSLADVVGQ